MTRPHPDMLRDKPHWVYRLYDEDSELLYVGCTYLEPAERIRSLRKGNGHIDSAPLHHWKAQLYPDMPTALAVEGMWIDSANPPLNGMRSGVAVRNSVIVDGPIGETEGVLRLRRKVSA